MADPVTWMMIAAATSAAGAISSGNQAKAAAESQANVADYNAKVDVMKATEASRVAGVQEDRQRQAARATIGMQLASSAGAGAGLNADLLRESFFNMESDSADIRYEGATRAAGLNESAMLGRANAVTQRQQGRAAQQAGYLSAAGSLMSAGSTYYKGQAAIKAKG